MYTRSNLHSLAARNERQRETQMPSSDIRSHANYRFLSTPEMAVRMQSLHKKKKALSLKVKRLEQKVAKAVEKSSVHLDEVTSSDIESIMNSEERNIEERYPEDSFQYVFWKQQKESLAKKGKSRNGIRWHPLMIKWCIYLRHQSSKAYDTLRDSGCISLPSQRTLRDYSNAVKAGAGFSAEVDQQLIEASRLLTSPSYCCYVALLIDEMHIKEDLVYNKHSGKLIGFVDLADINNHLARFEQSD